MAATKEKPMEDFYRARFGGEGMARFREVAKKVKAGKMTYRQAASTLGITYYELFRFWSKPGRLMH